jgi:hypothetical protein
VSNKIRRIAQILETKAYAGGAILEHDMYPVSPDRLLGIARRTLECLRQIGRAN